MPEPDAKTSIPHGNDARRRIVRHVVFNWAGYFVAVLTGFLLTPYIVHALGSARYGLWTILMSLTGYYGLLDLGVRGAVTTYVARALGAEDEGQLNRIVNNALVLFAAAAVLILVVTGLVVLFLPVWFSVPPEQVAATRWTAGILGALFAFAPMMAVWNALLYARERIDVNNVIAIGRQIAHAVLIVVALASGFGLMGMAVATALPAVVSWFFSYRLAKRFLPGLQVGRRHLGGGWYRELTGFGIFSFVGRLSSQIIEHTDVLVIGFVLADRTAVAYYAIGAALVPYFREVLAAVTRAFIPYAATLHARGDMKELARLHLAGSRWTFLFASVIVGGIYFLGEDFLAAWVGEEFVAGTAYPSSAVVLWILGTAMFLRMFQYCGLQILLAMKEVRFLAAVGAGEALANLILSLVLIRSFGLVGVALGTLIPVLFTQLFLEPAFLLKKVDTRWSTYLKSMLPGPVVTLVTMAALAWLLQGYRIASIPAVAVKGLVLVLPAFVLGAAAAAEPPERAAVVRRLCLAAGRLRRTA